MNIPLFLPVAAVVFVFSLVICFLLSKNEDRFSSVLTSLIISIISGIIANVASHAITYDWEPKATEPEVSISITETVSPSQPEIHVGDIISLGSYPQESSRSSPIDWIVLDKVDGKLLIISQNALDCQKYNSRGTGTTWESCSLRQWLNGSFYNAAFNSEEQKQILTTTVTADRNPQYSTDPGHDTQDKLFLLSIDEANQYFGSNSERLCRATAYAVNQGAYVSSGSGGSWWWLRTPGSSSKDAASVNSDGSIDYDDGTVTSSRGTVRPAMWISVS